MTEQAPAADQNVEYPRILAVGDSALLIEFGSEIDPGVNSRVYALAGQIEASHNAAVVELVPTYRSLLVNYNPLVSDYREMSRFLDEAVAGANEIPVSAAQPNVIELPVVYGGEDGPDLETVAEHAGLSTREVIEIPAGPDYRVSRLGFAPGFPYLGGLDPRIACPPAEDPPHESSCGFCWYRRIADRRLPERQSRWMAIDRQDRGEAVRPRFGNCKHIAIVNHPRFGSAVCPG